MKQVHCRALMVPEQGDQYAEESLYLRVYCDTIHKSQEVEITKVSIGQVMNKENKIHMCSAVLLSLFVTWIELEDIMLRGVSQAQKGNCRMFSGIDKEAKNVNPLGESVSGAKG